MSRRYELKSHTADVAIEAIGETRGEVFAAGADGLAAAHVDELPASDGDHYSVTRRAESLSALLVEYLNRLIYLRDVEAVLPVENEATVREVGDGYEIEATFRGVGLAGLAAREVKAVTYSQLCLERRGEAWYAYVVLDV